MKIKKEVEALKKAHEALQSKGADVEQQIEKREEAFDGKSEKWQDSVAGSEYADKTEAMQDQLDEFSQNLEDLEAIIGELENFVD